MPSDHDSRAAGAAQPSAPVLLHESSDAALVRVLGPDLQVATLRVVLYLALVAVIFATIARLVG